MITICLHDPHKYLKFSLELLPTTRMSRMAWGRLRWDRTMRHAIPSIVDCSTSLLINTTNRGFQWFERPANSDPGESLLLFEFSQLVKTVLGVDRHLPGVLRKGIRFSQNSFFYTHHHWFLRPANYKKLSLADRSVLATLADNLRSARLDFFSLLAKEISGDGW